MASQIIFFKKSRCDFELSDVTVTASEGEELANNVRNRSNSSPWITNDSSDASDTTLEVNFGDVRDVSDILLLKHNFKSYSIEYFDDDGAAWVPLLTVSDYAKASSRHSFETIDTSALRLTIHSTQIPNAEKYLFQFIATVMIGQLDGWPVFRRPSVGREVSVTKMLSGRSHLVERVGGYSTTLVVDNWKSAEDLAIVEDLYTTSEGFLFWPCGGDEDQFSSKRIGYRMEDIYLCRCSDRYQPEWVKGLYASGLKMEIALVEVNT